MHQFIAAGKCLTLASGSEARRGLLKAAGINFMIRPVPIDEEAIRQSARRQGKTGGEIALTLAHEKARACVAAEITKSDEIVIAADQILTCDTRQIDKATSIDALRETLRYLRGRKHYLQTATVLYCGNRPIWSHLASPALTMRDFTDVFLEEYLAQEGDAILSCVGGYRYEGRGVQLFSQVDGQNDAILGLPLLPLFAALRTEGVLMC